MPFFQDIINKYKADYEAIKAKYNPSADATTPKISSGGGSWGSTAQSMSFPVSRETIETQSAKGLREQQATAQQNGGR
jgi:hypothetical protein